MANQYTKHHDVIREFFARYENDLRRQIDTGTAKFRKNDVKSCQMSQADTTSRGSKGPGLSMSLESSLAGPGAIFPADYRRKPPRRASDDERVAKMMRLAEMPKKAGMK